MYNLFLLYIKNFSYQYCYLEMHMPSIKILHPAFDSSPKIGEFFMVRLGTHEGEPTSDSNYSCTNRL